MNTEQQLENSWRKSGISSFEGFFLRKDGKVEIEVDDFQDVGEFYENCMILTEKDAWTILLNSDDFRNEVEK